MKKLTCIFILFLFACNSEDANDCFQTSGDSIEETIVVSNFNKILVNRDIKLIIKQAPEYAVIVKTGKNLINDVTVEVVDDQLVLTDRNTCNYVRDYGITKIYVEAPNLTEIRTSSQYEITSNGTLNYANLNLFSEDFYEDTEFTVGDFRLTVSTENLDIISNNLSFFYIDGTVDNLFVGFFSGNGRFEGRDLIAQNVDIYHRGSNDMVVNPQQSIIGELKGTGDLILVNAPPVVAIERLYIGQLIFE